MIILLEEAGYEWAAFGVSLSYSLPDKLGREDAIARAKKVMPKLAYGDGSEKKFLRVMWTWLEVDFPRLLWQEADQYKISTTTLSESTVHTLKSRPVTQNDFCIDIDEKMIDILNEKISAYNSKEISLLTLKSYLPEGFLQKRMWNINYATIQYIYNQRKNHKIELWHIFLEELLSQLKYPEFIKKELISSE